MDGFVRVCVCGGGGGGNPQDLAVLLSLVRPILFFALLGLLEAGKHAWWQAGRRAGGRAGRQASLQAQEGKGTRVLRCVRSGWKFLIGRCQYDGDGGDRNREVIGSQESKRIVLKKERERERKKKEIFGQFSTHQL